MRNLWGWGKLLGSLAAAMSVAMGLLQVKTNDKHEIYKVTGVVPVPHRQHSVVRRMRNEIPMRNFQFPAVRQVDGKRLERDSFNQPAQSFAFHIMAFLVAHAPWPCKGCMTVASSLIGLPIRFVPRSRATMRMGVRRVAECRSIRRRPSPSPPPLRCG